MPGDISKYPRARLTRAAFLKSALGAAVGLSTIGTGITAAGAASDGRPPDGRTPEVIKLADLTGPGLTTGFRMEATSLGIPAVTPDGRTLFIFGDTFENAKVGNGWWRSPVGLYSTTKDLNSGVQWSGAVGGSVAEQLWPYVHNNPGFSTVLPTDVLTIGGSMYLHVMVCRENGSVVRTEIWRSEDSGGSWTFTGAQFDAELHGGLFQQLTWAPGGDGYVYIYSTGFQRDKPIILSRVRQDRIADSTAYQPWGYSEGAWAWGRTPTPVLAGKFGELCLRRLGGRWVLTWFNAGEDRIEGLIADSLTSNLELAERKTLVYGTHWAGEDDNHVAQLYGGYIIPGSTLNQLHLSVSQWKTDTGWPYKVMQFRVTDFAS
ncbi:DUF4185 domain-containing protein [Saxibacter everestensis]|uniref:DUF4185 domain-containing protein n=1 Tax=Saxibacter everestensis TaxID=2909229 RepID=A0ABY8QXK8_9MICO|nr:DUF4185 domain-containing protein [Brevibacteriaceae bacterium ZFBP1038]